MLKKVIKGKSKRNINTQDVPVISYTGDATPRLKINKAFYDEYFKGRNYIEYFIDDEDGMIGIKPLEEPTEDSYKLSPDSTTCNIRILVEEHSVKMTKGKLEFSYNDDIILVKATHIGKE